MKRALPVLGLVLLCGLVFLLGRQFRVWEDAASGPEEGHPDGFVPLEERYEGLDQAVLQGLRLPGGEGIEEVTLGALTIRKKKVGIVRIGAFNEAFLEDLRLVVNEKLFSAVDGGSNVVPKVVMPPAVKLGPGHSPPRRKKPSADPGVVSKSGEQLTGAIKDLHSGMLALSAFKKKKVSSITVDGFTFVLKRENAPELCLIRCDKMSPNVAGSSRRELSLGGKVMFRNVAGESLCCESAVMSLGKTVLIAAKDVTIVTPAGTKKRGRMSFPLDPLVINPGFQKVAE